MISRLHIVSLVVSVLFFSSPAVAGDPKAEPGACDILVNCCSAVVAGLEKAQGFPADALDEARKGCRELQLLEEKGAGQFMPEHECKRMLDTLQDNVDQYKIFPGFALVAGVCEYKAPVLRIESLGDLDGDHPCDRLVICCVALSDALLGVEGMPKEAAETMRKSCTQLAALQTTMDSDTSAQTCTTALEGFRKAIDAYKQLPGFAWPAGACK